MVHWDLTCAQQGEMLFGHPVVHGLTLRPQSAAQTWNADLSEIPVLIGHEGS